MKTLNLIFSALLLPVWLCSGAPKYNVQDVDLTQKVVDWQIRHFYDRAKPRHDLDWTNAILYRGMVMWSQTVACKPAEDFVMNIGQKNEWLCYKRRYHADDMAVAQSYLLLYNKFRNPQMLNPILARVDSILADPAEIPADFRIKVKEQNGKMRWFWCDALIMAPPVYVALYKITGDKSYLTFMDKEYRVTTDSLFDSQASLYYRDIRYKTQKEKNGEKVFWARGNAWVYAGLAMILNDLPKTYPSYEYYKNLFLKMSPAVVASQDIQGSWHPSMLDREAYPMPDNSASGLFLYGIAWGLNHHILKGKMYDQAAKKGWSAIKSYVQEDGKLGFVQPIGSSPEVASKDLTEVYGVGAFLMAASQMIQR